MNIIKALISISMLYLASGLVTLFGSNSFNDDPVMRQLIGEWQGPSTFTPVNGNPMTLNETNTSVLKKEGREIHFTVKAEFSGQIMQSKWVYKNLKKDGSFLAVFSDSNAIHEQFSGKILPDQSGYTLSGTDPKTKARMEIKVTLSGSVLRVKGRSTNGSSELLFEIEGLHKKSPSKGEVSDEPHDV